MKISFLFAATLLFISTTQAQVNVPSVKIGNQVWMKKNLNVIHYRNGDPIPQVTDPNEWARITTGAWCYYNNDPANGAKYGKLYNWYAVNDPRGLAPKGFHVSTDAEWTVLPNFLGGEIIAGQKIKSKSGWAQGGNGSDESGFSGLPGGFRDYNGTFNSVGGSGGWWSATEKNTVDAWYSYLTYGNGGVIREYSFMRNGLSVRCLRD